MFYKYDEHLSKILMEQCRNGSIVIFQAKRTSWINSKMFLLYC